MNSFRSHLPLTSHPQARSRLAAWLACALLGVCGCSQRAYNELYVENMATEIRLLEDRVYEYDAEYRALENELEDLQVINEGLESKLREAEQDRTDRSRPPKPETSRPEKPKESLKLAPSDEIKLDVETPVPPPRKLPSSPAGNELLPPKSDAAPTETLLPSNPGPSPLPDRPVLPDRAATDRASSDRASSDRASSSAPRGLPSMVARASYLERRIAAPVLPSPATQVASSPPGPGAANPMERRVREIDFHPGLCRGLKRDGNPNEAGVVLVLVPRNQNHEFVPVPGNVTVVIEETSEDQVHRLGKWEYSTAETAEVLEPVGSGQGIHLQLPWQDNLPKTNLVNVYVRFTDDQGITMVNHRQIHLRKSSPGQSTWTPK
jgi:hypothetical protein